MSLISMLCRNIVTNNLRIIIDSQFDLRAFYLHIGSNTYSGGIMNNTYTEKLSNQIWTTRVSRVNAEKRLLNKEQFIQFTNIYYSCTTIIFSILSYVKNDTQLNLISIFMTISLLVSIMYLNSQKYLQAAQDYRDNYSQLQQLELQLKHLDDDSKGELAKIENEYCKLMNGYSNHTTFDYYCTIAHAKELFKLENNWKEIRGKYYFGIIWRFLIKVFLAILPILLYLMKGIF